jgi:hypothetical protein
MRLARIAVISGLLLVGVAPAQAWMTFVSRDVATGERIGIGAYATNEGQDQTPRLSIICTPDGLAAMFDTGLDMPAARDDLPTALLVAADDGPFDPFPAVVTPYVLGESSQMRLQLDASEAMGLAEYVLGAQATIQVGYRKGDEEVVFSLSNDSAPISIGAVLGECEGRGPAKSKG